MNKIFQIKYGTNQYFEINKGDLYFCKSPTSTSKKLIELIEKNEKGFLKKDLKHLKNLVLFNLIQYPARTIQFNAGYETDGRLKDLYIQITQEELF